jgi:hypothetical protein
MKRTVISGLIAAALLLGGMTASTFAGNGPGNGKGYGGPPKSQEERAARQAACLEKNGGVCPNGGPRSAGECQGQGQGRGQGKGQGQGKGLRRGACDGTGPRAGTGNCPVNGSARTQK